MKRQFGMQLDNLKKDIVPALSKEQEEKVYELFLKYYKLSREMKEKYGIKLNTAAYHTRMSYEEIFIGGLQDVLTKEQFAYYHEKSASKRASRLRAIELYKEKMKSE